MKIAAFIPIKTTSKRVPGKNFRLLNEVPLYKYIISNTVNAGCFDEIYVDTDSDEIQEYANKLNLNIINRKKELAEDDANGNDLLVYHASITEDVDYFFQLFATAPLLSSKTINGCVNQLINGENDSCFTVTEETGWFWFQDYPVNYRPDVLPRSQDAKKVLKESTGLYGISKEALLKYSCRIGAHPIMIKIDSIEALDIDTEHEFSIVEKFIQDKESLIL